MSAIEMFNKLGFVLRVKNEEKIIYVCIENDDLYISFDLLEQYIGGMPYYDFLCDMPMLQAMNKQVEELGWNNDN